MAIINIVRRNGAVTFDPPSLNVARYDTVVFRNLDPQSQHQVTLLGQANDFWFQFPLAPYVEGQPADTSSELLFDQKLTGTPPASKTYSYICALHPERPNETGTIVQTS
jgi:plastocyanin